MVSAKGCAVHRVEDCLAIALLSVKQAHVHFQNEENVAFIDATPKLAGVDFASRKRSTSSASFRPCDLGKIYDFVKFILKARRENPSTLLVVCSGDDSSDVTMCTLLLGSFFIMYKNVSPDEVQSTLSALIPNARCFRDEKAKSNRCSCELSVIDCWNALFHAKRLGWIDFTNDDIDCRTCIDMEEFKHYDRFINGHIHVIVPSKLVAMSCPRDFPESSSPGDPNRNWCDIDGHRHFTAAYFGEILQDYEVQLVVSCAQTQYDARGFLDAQIAVEDLDLNCESSLLLKSTDRFLTLTKLAPGAIAIHGDDTSLGSAGMLVSAYLIKCYGFEAAHAMAWVWMLHPGLHLPTQTWALYRHDSTLPRCHSELACHGSTHALDDLACCLSPPKHALVSDCGRRATLSSSSARHSVSLPDLTHAAAAAEGVRRHKGVEREAEKAEKAEAESKPANTAGLVRSTSFVRRAINTFFYGVDA